MKSYSEVMYYNSFEDRFEYLKLKGHVGEDTFGSHRYLNQRFYSSIEWRNFRNHIIARDNGCDLGIKDRPIYGKVFIHHINPLTLDDVINGKSSLIDPENAITVSFETHQALHYGNDNLLPKTNIVARKPNDTCPWK